MSQFLVQQTPLRGSFSSLRVTKGLVDFFSFTIVTKVVFLGICEGTNRLSPVTSNFMSSWHKDEWRQMKWLSEGTDTYFVAQYTLYLIL